MLSVVRQGFVAAGEAIAAVHLRDGLNEAMSVARAANRYLDEQAPWKRIKTDRDGAATTVYTMIQVLNGLKVLFAPYVPFSSQKLHELLGFSGNVANCAWRLEEVPVGQSCLSRRHSLPSSTLPLCLRAVCSTGLSRKGQNYATHCDSGRRQL